MGPDIRHRAIFLRCWSRYHSDFVLGMLSQTDALAL